MSEPTHDNSPNGTTGTSPVRVAAGPDEIIRALAEDLPVVVFELDARGIFLSSTGAGRRRVEERAEDPVGTSAFDLYADAPTVLRNLRRALSGEAFVARAEVPRAGAPPALFDVAHVPVRRPDGTVERVTGFAIDVTARETVARELSWANAALRSYAARLQTERETERARVSRMVHDRIGQTLTALRFEARWLRRQFEGACPLDHDGLLARINELDASVTETLGVVRDLSAELRPPVLDALGLTAALQSMAERFVPRTGVACTVRSTLDASDEAALGKRRATAAFRIAQEALTNVARHARARRVYVALDVRPPDADVGCRVLSLVVRDDGVGVTPEELALPSTGFTGMRERAAEWGGQVVVEPGDPVGTMVSVRIPLGDST